MKFLALFKLNLKKLYIKILNYKIKKMKKIFKIEKFLKKKKKKNLKMKKIFIIEKFINKKKKNYLKLKNKQHEYENSKSCKEKNSTIYDLNFEDERFEEENSENINSYYDNIFNALENTHESQESCPVNQEIFTNFDTIDASIDSTNLSTKE